MSRKWGFLASVAAAFCYLVVRRLGLRSQRSLEEINHQLIIRDELSRITERTVLQLYTKIDSVRSRLSTLIPSSGPSLSGSSEDFTSKWDHFRNSMSELVKPDELNPDCFKSVPDMVRSYQTEDGDFYPCEEITAETKDGFLLTIQRLPNDGPAVILQHGILADSGNWVCGGPSHGLAFILWRAGFDVYLGNSRGNPYSRRHTTLDPKKSEFWKWSFQDLADYDFPATIDKVCEVSQREKVWYIGHSQGSLIAFAALSDDKQNLSSKINGIIGLAPVFTLQFVKGPWRIFCPMIGKLITGKVVNPDGEMLPNTRAGRWIAKVATVSPGRVKSLGYKSARNLLLIWANFDPSRYLADRLEVFLSHTPAGTSFRNIIHFAQNIGRTANLKKLDYGKKSRNFEVYGTETPPTYDFTKIKTNLHLFYGSNDWLATVKDVEGFVESVRDNSSTVVNAYKSDNDHLDFIWGKESNLILYPKIVQIIQTSS